MKKYILILFLISALLLSSCAAQPSADPASAAVSPSAEATPTLSAEPTISAEPTVSAEPEATPSSEMTEDPFEEDDEPVGDPVVVDDLMVNTALDDNGWWNILLLGSDARYSDGHGRTDNMVILSVHPETRSAKLSSIMRDTWVNIYGKGYNKINTANRFGGPELSIRTVNECFDMNISHYVLVDMQSLVSIIDAIGGVTLDITADEQYVINSQLASDVNDFYVSNASPLREHGEGVHLNGNQALAYSRIRHLDSDYVRTERQRKVLIAIAQELQNSTASELMDVITTLIGYVKTNLSLNEILSLANTGMSIDLSTVSQFRLPVDGTFVSGYKDGTWCIQPDFEANQKLLHEFIYGTAEVE